MVSWNVKAEEEGDESNPFFYVITSNIFSISPIVNMKPVSKLSILAFLFPQDRFQFSLIFSLQFSNVPIIILFPFSAFPGEEKFMLSFLEKEWLVKL